MSCWKVVLGMLLVAAVLSLHVPAEMEAQVVECEAVDLDGNLRNCTWSEEWGMCLWEAAVAYEQCKDDDMKWYEKLGCYSLYVADYWACTAQATVSFMIS